MELKAEGKVTGFKYWDEPAQDGKAIDSGTVYIETSLKGGNAKGFATHEFKCSSASIIKQIHHTPPPFMAMLTLEQETDGKGGSRQIVTRIEPTKPAQASAPAQGQRQPATA
jgi:hypothetical protein